MCGIIGAIADRDVVPILIDSLKRLEYRGYDSSGIAVVDGERITRVRRTGYVSEMEQAALALKLRTTVGIGHTRWATHGGVTEENAHPHMSGDIVVVHNGVVENHNEHRAKLLALGYVFTSDTDTEVIAHLLHWHCAQGKDLPSAVHLVVRELRGAFAVVVLSAAQPRELVCARMGCPLVVGVGDGEHFVASDVSALAAVTQRVVVLRDGDVAVLRRDGVDVTDASQQPVERPVRQSDVCAAALELGAHQHFMQKEIHEQPQALTATVRAAVESVAFAPEVFGPAAAATLRGVEGVLVLACGSSYYAGCIARQWVEALAGLPCAVEVASEYRYRAPHAQPTHLVVAVSQSGETLDTLEALKHAKARGHRHTLALCNVRDSAIAAECELGGFTAAGPEVGVASTKAFTAQLALLFHLAVVLGRLRGALCPADEVTYVEQLRALPNAVQRCLNLEAQVQVWAQGLAGCRHALYLGRGLLSAVAMEGALKMKEIAYVHAEACPAGELKHGPLALVDADMPVVVLVPSDGLRDKVKANISEVRARGGQMYLIAEEGCDLAGCEGEGVRVIRTPQFAGPLAPVMMTIPLQLLAYHVALVRGNNVDRPRNLSKTVTVE